MRVRRPSALLLAGVAIASLTAAIPRADGAPDSRIPVWAPDWMGTQQGAITRSLALRQAGVFDVIIAQPGQYKSYVSQMEAANPSLTLYVYRNAVAQGLATFPESYYTHTAAGARIRFPQWGTYEMNPKSPGWISELTSECRSLMASSDYEGCFLDVLGVSGVNPRDVTGLPTNPSTGRAYTQRDWMLATTSLAKQVIRALAPHPVIGNGLLTGSKYFDATAPTESLLDSGMKAGMVEAFVRSAHDAVTSYRGEAQWRQDIDMLLDIAKRSTGNVAVVVTKVWTTASSAQISAWETYSLATFLLGWVPGHTYFSFRADKLLTAPSALYRLAIGTPTGSYAKVEGVYQRTFTTGRVLVNPTSSTFRVQLGGSYEDPQGHVITSITMTPHAGAILERA